MARLPGVAARKCGGPWPWGVLLVAVSAVMTQGGSCLAEGATTERASQPAETAKVARATAIPLGAPDRAQYWFGVAVENLPPAIAKQLKLKPDQGLMVVAVLPNSPAEQAGLKAEDLLIELDGVPLASQEDLARAANTNRTYRLNSNTQVPMPLMKKSRITFLREGDRKDVDVTPAPRPENMLVLGNNRDAFSAQGGRGAGGDSGGSNNAAGIEVRNVVLPNGTTAQVGPGYTVDLTGDAGGGAAGGASTLVVQSIKQLMGRGETIVLTQQTDSSGNVKNTIVAGGKPYVVEAGKVETLPVELRPLALQLLAGSPAADKGGAKAVTVADGKVAMEGEGPAAGANALEQRVSDLEKQNQALQEQLKELIGLMQKQNANR